MATININRKLPTVIKISLFVLFLVLLRRFPTDSKRVKSIPETVNTPHHMIELINKARATYGVPALAESSILNQTAKSKACDMLDKSYFSHDEPPNDREPWHWFDEAGYEYEYAGENLARDYNDQYDEMVMLMTSPEHKKNILSTDYTEVGVGICDKYTVQHFGKPI